jgi:mannose-6-phosphate isomerase-like protein (cupin superfamily)
MSSFTVRQLADVPDVLGEYPGEMRFFSEQLGCEQVAFTYRRMPAKTGGKGAYGHRHKRQEEIYFVISGRLEFKLADELLELGPGSAVRVAPELARSVWNEGPEDAQLVICSVRVDDPRADTEVVEDFWPD